MVKIEILMGEGKVTRISELELGRYVNFFENSYEENLEHSTAVMVSYPRWSILHRNKVHEGRIRKTRLRIYVGSCCSVC